jgi:hypothetical protein
MCTYLLLNIKARSPSEEYMRNQKPLFMSTISGKLFYIYTGLEDVLHGDKKRVHITTDTGVAYYKRWTIIMSGDSMKINKNGGIPFFPSNEENPYYNGKLTATDSASIR